MLGQNAEVSMLLRYMTSIFTIIQTQRILKYYIRMLTVKARLYILRILPKAPMIFRFGMAMDQIKGGLRGR